jgi:hemerythrin
MAENTFVWTKSLEVGNNLMDEEHQELIARMGRLHQINATSLDKKLILMGMDEFIRITRHHFNDEEKLMKEVGYPGLEQHQRIHEGLFGALDRYRAELASSVYHRFPSSVFDFMKTWITSHIMMVDQQYANHIKNMTKAS